MSRMWRWNNFTLSLFRGSSRDYHSCYSEIDLDTFNRLAYSSPNVDVSLFSAIAKLDALAY